MVSKELKINEKFYGGACRNMGYDLISAINELVDNSKDAGATQVNIAYDHNNKCLVISDNGKGMSYDELNNAMEFSPEKEYTSKDVAFYGVGMKTSIINIGNFDEGFNAVINSYKDGKMSRVLWNINKENVSTFEIGDIGKCDRSNGTEITITKVNIDFYTLNNLYRSLGVTYYPSISKGTFKIHLNCTTPETEKVCPIKGLNQLSFENLTIEATDPMYRDKTDFIIGERTVTVPVNYNDNTYEIVIKSVCLNDVTDENRIPWDVRKGADGGVKALKRSGLYIIYGGRYIEMGDNFNLFGLPNQYFFAGMRAEFEIPKELTSLFGVKFNKTSGLKEIDKTPELKDIAVKVKNVFNYFMRECSVHQSKRKTIKDKQTDFKFNKKNILIEEKAYGNSTIPWFVEYNQDKTVVILNIQSEVYQKVINNSANSNELKENFKLFAAATAASCEELFDDNSKTIALMSKIGEKIDLLINKKTN